ncbi:MULTISPECIES: ferredoxin [Streptomyces]|uniref:Ferredoxin n=2 Tax=Streptomyces TaxID=1883 RepID=A0A646K9L6_STRJU|nr:MULTISPECIES: ferredoxin [Streptomyces]MQS34983.1 ferredoxin [Streptomyces katsurahamanus]MQS98833.1 ferredoxin [Streptomyces jumonjinensis]
MRIEIDRDVCIGAALCALTAPEVFTQDDDGLSELLPARPGETHEAKARQAARTCPVQAITAVGENEPAG